MQATMLLVTAAVVLMTQTASAEVRKVSPYYAKCRTMVRNQPGMTSSIKGACTAACSALIQQCVHNKGRI